jgi:hypothetical protein
MDRALAAPRAPQQCRSNNVAILPYRSAEDDRRAPLTRRQRHSRGLLFCFIGLLAIFGAINYIIWLEAIEVRFVPWLTMISAAAVGIAARRMYFRERP